MSDESRDNRCLKCGSLHSEHNPENGECPDDSGSRYRSPRVNPFTHREYSEDELEQFEK